MSFTLATPALFAPESQGAKRIVLEEGRIAAVLPPGRADESWPGPIVPGFVDLQCNGIDDISFADIGRKDWQTARHKLLRTGTTTVLPTIVTSTDPAQALADFAPGGTPDMPGAHLEGPALNPLRAGAHKKTDLRPLSLATITQLPIVLVTFATERAGGIKTATMLRSHGITPAIGHSNATLEEADEAFRMGVRLVTHLWNALPPLHHRAPGIVGAALTDARVTVCLICDGIHVHPRIIQLTIQAKGPHRVAAVSDLVAPTRRAGLGEIRRVAGAIRTPEGILAGSCTTMDEVFRRLVNWGHSMETAAMLTATTPAAALGLFDRGRIAPGLRADLVGFTTDLHLAWTRCTGEHATGPDLA